MKTTLHETVCLFNDWEFCIQNMRVSIVLNSESDVKANGLTSTCFSTVSFFLVFLTWVLFNSEILILQISRNFSDFYSLLFWTTIISLSSSFVLVVFANYFMSHRIFMYLPTFLWKCSVKKVTVCFVFNLMFFFSFSVIFRTFMVFTISSYFEFTYFIVCFVPATYKCLSDSMCLK